MSIISFSLSVGGCQREELEQNSRISNCYWFFLVCHFRMGTSDGLMWSNFVNFMFSSCRCSIKCRHQLQSGFNQHFYFNNESHDTVKGVKDNYDFFFTELYSNFQITVPRVQEVGWGGTGSSNPLHTTYPALDGRQAKLVTEHSSALG